MKKNLLIALWLLASCKNVIHPIEGSYDPGSTNDFVSTSIHPNIILIVGDDIGYEIPTCNGGQSYQTPNLDNMAAQGRRFTQCHSSPLCSPSRFALLTGKYNFRNYTNWGHMDPSNKTIGNMLQDAGYSTCYAGKWQLDGYDASIHAFGWQKYSVWEPAKKTDPGSRYKNPHIYQDGNFLPDSVTQNKYADDMFTDYMTAFMDTVKKPYFIYYSMSLAHMPFSPTPDDPEFAGWNPNNPSDSKFFPSMIKYMDKKIGQLMSRVDSNTIIIYVGDNGTPPEINSLLNGITIPGGKGHCTEYGTHVPLIVYEPGKGGSIDKSLVDLTDFLPTLAGIAKISLPVNYGILDGTVFYPKKSTRQWIYYHYNWHPDNNLNDLTVWVQNSVYKKYDTTVQDRYLARKNKFYNINLDPYEQNPILRTNQTAAEKSIDSSFKSIIQYYLLQQ